MKQTLDYLADRVLEHGSLSAYCVAIMAAWEPTLPMPAKAAIFAAATYKFLRQG